MMVMIRPRAGDFRADATLLTRMELDIERALDGGADGLVFGVLDEREEVDEHALERLVTAARGRPVTFHRAFDSVPDPDVALERLVELGVTRILTSGGAPTALEGASVLARLIARAGERIAILPGGHVRSENASELLRQTGARELHSAVAKDADLTVARVARLAESMSR
jgi:copper homeostasis protein